MATSLSLWCIPSELRAAHRQFEQWRRVRQPGDRIPDHLWAAAAAAAHTHGVSRTARLLHLEGRKLKQVVNGAHPAPRPSMAPPFVELPVPMMTGSGECTIELEGPHGGRLRVQLRGTPGPDLVALARLMWGADA
jgi:hypothetical protein